MKDKLDSKGLMIKYAALQGNYWMIFCPVFGYVSVYLLAKGFSAGSIGVLTAWANVMAAVLQPWIASWADRSERFTLKNFMMVLAVMGTIPAIVLVFFPDLRMVIGLMYILIMTIVSVLQPLANAVNGYYVRRGYSMNFGIARGIGSLSFAILSGILGYLITRLGENVIPLSIIILMISMIVVLSRFHMERKTGGGEAIIKTEKRSNIDFFRKHKIFFLLLTGLMLIFVTHNMINTYLIQILGQFGGNSSDMGASVALAAICEIPMMFLFGRIVKTVKSNQLLRIAALGFLAKIIAIWMAKSILMIHMSQLLQGVSFAIMIPALVYYSDEIMAEEDRVTGQALITTAIVIGAMFGNLFGGKLIDWSGAPTMLLAGVGCTAVGVLLLCVSAVPMRERGQG